MKKFVVTGCVIATLGAILLLPSLLGNPAVLSEILISGNARIAIADRACPEPDQPAGYAYLQENCLWWKTVHTNWCVCATESTSLLTGELTDYSVIPESYLSKFVVCRLDTDPTKQFAGFVEQSRVIPPVGWTCVVVIERQPWIYSHAHVRTKLVDKLKIDCAPCVITPTRWGQCPYCLLPGAQSCAEVCQ